MLQERRLLVCGSLPMTRPYGKPRTMRHEALAAPSSTVCLIPGQPRPYSSATVPQKVAS